MSLGRNLTIILYDKKMSQKELAKKIGISESVMARIVNDKKMPSVEKLVRISNALGVTTDELLK